MKGNKVCAIVPEVVALGLSLAGVSEILVHGANTDLKVMRDWVKERIVEGAGLIILSRESSEILSKELFDHRISGELLPVMVVIPGDKEDKRASDLIKRAIGMDPSKTLGDTTEDKKIDLEGGTI
jgi:vacuolar-type H+-ATPase subunit F/Vma7